MHDRDDRALEDEGTVEVQVRRNAGIRTESASGRMRRNRCRRARRSEACGRNRVVRNSRDPRVLPLADTRFQGNRNLSLAVEVSMHQYLTIPSGFLPLARVLAMRFPGPGFGWDSAGRPVLNIKLPDADSAQALSRATVKQAATFCWQGADSFTLEFRKNLGK